MSIKLKTPPDLTLLPTAMLADAKTHMRVDWTYDDQFIQSCVARALARFEQMNEVALNKATYDWTPGPDDFIDNLRARVPVTPVNSFTAKLADNTDVSTGYTVTTDTVFGVPLLYLNGAYQSGVVVTLDTGFTVLPPPIVDIVLRNAAHLYEHREILIPGAEFVSPDMQVDATWWVPRA